MKTIELSMSNRFICGGKLYLGDKEYTMADNAADALLEKCDGRDIPYFREVTKKKGGKAKPKAKRQSRAKTPESVAAAKKKAVEKASTPKLEEGIADADEDPNEGIPDRGNEPEVAV